VVTVLKWKRIEAGQYHAYGETHSYYVECREGQWRIRIFKDLKPVALNYYGDNKRENVMLANAFESLGDGYRSADHQHRERITEAVAITHKAIMDEITGNVDTEDANPVRSNHTPAEEVDVNGESKETRAVMSALQTETDMYTPAGVRFQMDSLEAYTRDAKRWLGDNSECSGEEIDNADYSVALEYFREISDWQPRGVANGGANPLKSETQSSGKGPIVTDSKLFVPANRQAVHFTENVEKCNTVKRAAGREFAGYPFITLEEAQHIKACANCAPEVEAEMILMAEALEANQDADTDTEAQEGPEDAPEAVEAPEDDDQEEEDAEEEESPEDRAAREFNVSDPWKAWENWGQLAKANRPKGDDDESQAYLYWDDKTSRIGEILGAE
jgi:hypothetical protein